MHHITKAFPGVIANNDVTFEVERGDIHGLLGENGAGKTTLMNILYGVLQPDSGHVEVDGVEARIRNPRDALALGIGMVHQQFMLVPNMTVAENVALGLRSTRAPLSNLDRVSAVIAELSAQYGLAVEPDHRIEYLSVGLQQRVEIMKLLYRGARILILDEPTSALTAPEWLDLSNVLLALVAEGRSVVFITHKLDELLAVASQCTVLRDGAVVDSVAVRDTDKPSLARMMVGRDVILRTERRPIEPGAVVLETSNLTLEAAEGRRILDGVDLHVREHEVLGVAGVDGNGQSELVDVLTGLVAPTSGSIFIDGSTIPSLSPTDFSERFSGAVIPADRQRSAVALRLSVADNVMMRDFRRHPYCHHGVLASRAIRQHCERLISTYDIRGARLGARMQQLSGGNQQKVVLARELHRVPRLLIAAQPTRGLDVGAMDFIYERIAEHRQRGGATLLLSSDLEEVLSLSDRVAVMVRGRLVETVPSDEIDQEALGLLISGEIRPRT